MTSRDKMNQKCLMDSLFLCSVTHGVYTTTSIFSTGFCLVKNAVPDLSHTNQG